MESVFLINQSLITTEIADILKKNGILVYTTSKEDFLKKAKQYVNTSGIDNIYAVGGDGTVNLLASVIAGTDKKLGIIPIGRKNRIYRSIKDDKTIDFGYINNYLFLNHAAILGDGFVLDKISFRNRGSFNHLEAFEFATNFTGKYRIHEASAIIIFNGDFDSKKASISDRKMETYFVLNNGLLSKDIKVEKEKIEFDMLGLRPIVVDGELFSIDRFIYRMGGNINLAENDIAKKLSLIKNSETNN